MESLVLAARHHEAPRPAPVTLKEAVRNPTQANPTLRPKRPVKVEATQSLLSGGDATPRLQRGSVLGFEGDKDKMALEIRVELLKRVRGGE